MNFNEAFPSKYLKSDSDVPEEGDLIVTISKVDMEMVGQGAKAERKPVLYFRETEKGLVCNVTNGKTISKLYGNDTDDWIGKRIALYSADVEFAGEMKRGIRVKTRAPKSAPEPAARPAGPGVSPPRPARYEQVAEDDEDVPF